MSKKPTIKINFVNGCLQQETGHLVHAVTVVVLLEGQCYAHHRHICTIVGIANCNILFFMTMITLSISNAAIHRGRK